MALPTATPSRVVEEQIPSPVAEEQIPSPTPTVVVPTATPTKEVAATTSPGVSTEGKIAFAPFPESIIYTMNADGSNLQRLTTGLDPDWNPTGDRLAFVDWHETNGVYLINADGSGRVRIHDWPLIKEPDWSPDGNQIVVSVQKGGPLKVYEKCFFGRFCFEFDPDPKWRLRVIKLDSSQINESAHFDQSLGPIWISNQEILFTGDGRLHIDNPFNNETARRINDRGPFVDPRYCALTSKIAATYHQHDHWEVHSLHNEGMSVQRLTGSDSVLSEPTGNNIAGTWSPDCLHFVFFSDRDGRWRPYIMNADGSNKQLFLPEVFDQFTFDFDYGFNNNKLIDWVQ